MNNSKVFHEYMRISKEKGLVSSTIEKKAWDEKKRYDSRSFSDIEALYGIKPKGIDEKEDIIEVAHPDTCIIAPAYDAQNGLIENLWQRQSIMVDIALKTPDGSLVHRKYASAKEDLTREIISIAFSMDNDDETELMTLADSCGELIVKEAAPPLFLGVGALSAAGIAAAVASVAALAYLSYKSTDPTNVKNNANQVLDAADNSTTFLPIASNIAKEVTPLVSQADSLTDILKSENPAQGSAAFLNSYKANLSKVSAMIPKWTAELIKSEAISSRDEEDSDWWNTLKGVVNLVPSRLISGIDSGAYVRNLNDKLQALGGAISKELSDINNIQSSVSSSPAAQTPSGAQQMAQQFIQMATSAPTVATAMEFYRILK